MGRFSSAGFGHTQLPPMKYQETGSTTFQFSTFSREVAATNKSKCYQASPDLTTLLNPDHRTKIIQNLVDRLIVKNEEDASKMLQDLYDLMGQSDTAENREKLSNAAMQFPNFSHSSVINLKEPRTLFDNSCSFDPKHLDTIRDFDRLSKVMHGARTTHTGE